ncbi:uncharacterized protein LOC136038072 isoform X1 [Artemia franciscana]
MAENQNLWSTWRIVASSIGTLAGLAASLSFFFVFHAYEAAIWALISAAVAVSALLLAVGDKRGDIEFWFNIRGLKKVQTVGFSIMAISLGFFGWYLFTGLYYHIPVMPAEHSALIVSVWAFMTAKWGMAIFLFSGVAAKRIGSESPTLIDA